MEVQHIQSMEVCVPLGSEQEKQKWAKEHAIQMQHLFEQWQKELGIDGEEYRKQLAGELVSCCDKPLLKSLIESIA